MIESKLVSEEGKEFVIIALYLYAPLPLSSVEQGLFQGSSRRCMGSSGRPGEMPCSNFKLRECRCYYWFSWELKVRL